MLLLLNNRICIFEETVSMFLEVKPAKVHIMNGSTNNNF